MSAAVKAMCDRLVAERTASLIATGQGRAAFTAYLAGLESRYPHDPAMRTYVARSRALLNREVAGGD